jgi:KTSC domain
MVCLGQLGRRVSSRRIVVYAMSKMIDVDKVQEALNRAAVTEDRAGRFRLEARMPRVNSSMMTEVGYDDGRAELDITFVGGKTYRYFEVPPGVYDGLLDSESKGEFFNENIKDAYRYSEVVGRPKK